MPLVAGLPGSSAGPTKALVGPGCSSAAGAALDDNARLGGHGVSFGVVSMCAVIAVRIRSRSSGDSAGVGVGSVIFVSLHFLCL